MTQSPSPGQNQIAASLQIYFENSQKKIQGLLRLQPGSNGTRLANITFVRSNSSGIWSTINNMWTALQYKWAKLLSRMNFGNFGFTKVIQIIEKEALSSPDLMRPELEKIAAASQISQKIRSEASRILHLMPKLDQEETEQVERLDQKIVEKIEVETSEPKNKYDKQIIIDFGSGNSARGLQQKPTAPPTTILPGSKNLDLSSMKELTPKSRLYIIGHCQAGLDLIHGDDGKGGIRVKNIVDALKNNESLKAAPPPRLKISLVACQAAARPNFDENKKSFAEMLSFELDKVGVHVEVVGFVYKLQRTTTEEEIKSYHKKVEGLTTSKQPHTKRSFITENGVSQMRSLYTGHTEEE